jgi:hypothetical protein
MRVDLLRVADCPNAAAARRVVEECLAAVGAAVPIVEAVGPFASPTVLVDGRDVMGTPDTPGAEAACRLDLPTAERVLAAMRASLAPGQT